MFNKNIKITKPLTAQDDERTPADNFNEVWACHLSHKKKQIAYTFMSAKDFEQQCNLGCSKHSFENLKEQSSCYSKMKKGTEFILFVYAGSNTDDFAASLGKLSEEVNTGEHEKNKDDLNHCLYSAANLACFDYVR